MIDRLKLKSEFSRNVLVLMTGTTIAQAIPIAISPILARLYTPEDFGLLALYLAVFGILSTIASGRYELAVMAPANDKEAKDVVFLSILVAFFMLALLSIPIWAFNDEISGLLGNDEIGVWLYFLPVAVFSVSIFKSLDYWFNRQRRYRDMVRNKLIKTTSISLAQLLLFYFTSAGMIIGSILGWFLSVVVITRKAEIKLNEFDPVGTLEVAKKYKEYPLLQAPFSALNNVSTQIPLLVVAKIFDMGVVGFYSMVIKILGAPVALIGVSFGQVFFQRVSDHADSAPTLLKADLYSVAKKLSLIALVVFLPVFFYGIELFAFVFGQDWAQAGAYAEILVVAIGVKFVVSPLSTIFLAVGRLKTISAWQLCYFISTCLVLFVASSFKVETFLWIYVWHEVLLYGIYFYLMVRVVKSCAD